MKYFLYQCQACEDLDCIKEFEGESHYTGVLNCSKCKAKDTMTQVREITEEEHTELFPRSYGSTKQIAQQVANAE